MAWSAYQASDYAGAAAWLAKAPTEDGLALWLRAKLALRDGHTGDAAAFFARAVRSYPKDIKDVDGAPLEGQPIGDPKNFRARQFQSDLGVISLSRSDYAQALTALAEKRLFGMTPPTWPNRL